MVDNPLNIRRRIETAIRKALSDTPAILLVGARQTGKSTLCRSLAAGPHPARYLTFDDATVLSAARKDPAGFVAGLGGPVVLDEIQRAPELLPAIKLTIDRDRRPGRFLLTGSANALVLPRVSESLAGRMEVLTLWPFSQGEIAGVEEGFLDALFAEDPPPPPARIDGRADLLARAVGGGYPEVVGRADPDRRAAWFGSYITAILQRDVRDIARVDDLSALPRILAILAARAAWAASFLNFSEVSRSAGIPLTTLKRYMALLEATFLVRSIPAWATNPSKRLIRTPRLAIADTGLLAHLAGLTVERIEENPTVAGPLIENFAAMELAKQASWSPRPPGLFHFRTHAGREVDIVLEAPDGRIAGIEVKASAGVDAKDFRGLETLAETAGKEFHRGVVLYAGRESVPFGPRMWALPLSSIWRTAAPPTRRRG